MYRHILVPIDDSPLSVDTVQQAVTFARAIDAKVTFFHAQADYASSSVGALERVMSPATFNEEVAGEARALLAKAEVVARTAGVAHDALAITSDRPHEAILGAAETRGCDLIFMASHGRRGVKGLVLGSQTTKVLQRATLPVLVASVESNVTATAADTALAILRDEHRSLAAVIHGLEYLVREARDAQEPASIPLLRAMVHYVRAFPEKLHHPKEDAYLFPLLRARTSEYDDTLDTLDAQHHTGSALVDALDAAVSAYEADRESALPELTRAVGRFASAQMDHMMLEAKVVIPAARQHLTEQDWTLIANAMRDNGDPRFCVDADEEYRHLFARILNLAPAGVVGSEQ
jgi:nucleotide-binding universal stress UspA family protein/hemerythrin-like domain-containing protein